MEAGCPPQAFGFYPTDYSGAGEILLQCGRSLLFGGGSTVAPWQANPNVQIHGPGRSKIIIAADRVSRWEEYLDLMVSSVAENGGRSCINASGVWVPSHGREIAEALAKRLAEIAPKPLDDPDAEIAAFTNPKVAEGISGLIDKPTESSRCNGSDSQISEMEDGWLRQPAAPSSIRLLFGVKIRNIHWQIRSFYFPLSVW